MQLLNSRVKSEGNYGRKGHGGDSGADVPFLRTHAGGRSPRGLGQCERLSSRHHTLNTTARGCLCPRPACALTGDTLSKAARPGRSTGSIHGVPQRSPTTESSLLAGGWVPRPREGSFELLQVRESLPCCWVSNRTNSECPLCPGLERLGNGGAPKPQAPPRDAVATQRI